LSQPTAGNTDGDRWAAEAVVRHHAELSATLTRQVTALVEAAKIGTLRRTWLHREQLLTWLRTELLPHAGAEETTLYPAAAAQPSGRLLVDGMVIEHHAITALVAELEAADTQMDAAAAARALSVLFEVHLAKENDLILPMLLAAEQTSLAELLEGMHALLGADESGEPRAGESKAGESGAGGCGSGGSCGCGGDASEADAPAPVLTVDARLDVRSLPHGQRHARVLAALDALPADGALMLIAPHAPRPLLAEIDARYAGQIDTQWLQDGPDVWQIRLHRHATAN
jgi:uncharacterized protein (DUF2249 family)